MPFFMRICMGLWRRWMVPENVKSRGLQTSLFDDADCNGWKGKAPGVMKIVTQTTRTK